MRAALRLAPLLLALGVSVALWPAAAHVFGFDEYVRAVTVQDLRRLGDHEARFMIAVTTLEALLLAVAVRTIPPRASAWLEERARELLLRPERTYLACALLGASVAFASALLATDVHTLSEDEKTYLFQAGLLSMGKLSVVVPPEAEAFRVPFLVMHAGRMTGQYFWATPALLALAHAVTTPWIVSPIELGLTIAWSGAAATRLSGDARVGVVTALILATSPLAVLNAATLLNVNLAATCIAASLWGISVLKDEPSRAATLALGLSTGVALHNRPFDHVGILAGALAMLLCAGGEPRARLRRLVPAFSVALPFAALLLLTNREVTGDPFQSGYSLFAAGHGWRNFGFGTGPFNRPHTLRIAAAATVSNVARSLFDLTGCPVLVVLGALASWAPEVAGRRLRAAAITISLVYFAAYFFYASVPISVVGPVYFVPLAPVLAAWVASGLIAANEALRRLGTPGSMTSVVVFGTALGFWLVWPLDLADLHEASTESQAARLERLVHESGVHRALVFVGADFPALPSWEQQPPFPSPRLDDDVLYVVSKGKAADALVEARFGPGRSAYLVGEEGPEGSGLRRYAP